MDNSGLVTRFQNFQSAAATPGPETIRKNSAAAAVSRESPPASHRRSKLRAGRRRSDLDPVKFWAVVALAAACVLYGVIAKWQGWL